MRKIQNEIQDITQSALVTAIVFISDLLFGAGFSYQYYAYFFIGGVFYIRLRMIGLDLEAVQKQLNNPALTGQKDETITVRSTLESTKDKTATVDSRKPGIESIRSAVESIKDEIATIRSYVVIAIETNLEVHR